MKRSEAIQKLSKSCLIPELKAAEIIKFCEEKFRMRRIEYRSSGCCHSMREGCNCQGSWLFGFEGDQRENYI